MDIPLMAIRRDDLRGLLRERLRIERTDPRIAREVPLVESQNLFQAVYVHRGH